jgi:hypothetical protein
VLFHLNGEPGPSAVTGVQGEVTDILLPSVGDVVSHRDGEGAPFTGRVTERVFNYDLSDGHGVIGAVSVTLFLDRLLVH